MSFSLHVLAQRLPEDFVSRWKESLANYGLHCEFPPGLSLGEWRGGYLPVKLDVDPNAFPSAGRYGAQSLLAGFELDLSGTASGWEALELPARLSERMRQVEREFFLETHLGRTVADLRLQCFAAATLAIITDGVLYDGQQGVYYFGEEGIEAAAREAGEYENNLSEEDEWENLVFPGWEALGYGAT
jgi:hypothetical protein